MPRAAFLDPRRAERTCRVDRHAAKHFGCSHAETARKPCSSPAGAKRSARFRLQSVETAICTPSARIFSIGGSARLAQKIERTGQQPATTPCAPSLAATRRTRIRDDPPIARRGAQRCRRRRRRSTDRHADAASGRDLRARSNTRSVCSRVKAMRSQNTSAASASCSAATAGSMSSHT